MHESDLVELLMRSLGISREEARSRVRAVPRRGKIVVEGLVYTRIDSDDDDGRGTARFKLD